MTPFKSGKKHGVQKKYYESGKLMAEIPYENGKLIAGTKEFSKDGDIITDTPEILVKERDLTLLQGTYYVEVWLQKSVGKTEFYRIKDNGTQTIAEKMENGRHRFGFLSVPNNTEFVEFTIYAKTRTKMNNPILVKKDMRIVLGG